MTFRVRPELISRSTHAFLRGWGRRMERMERKGAGLFRRKHGYNLCRYAAVNGCIRPLRSGWRYSGAEACGNQKQSRQPV